jgi:phosphoesterase RecJ-like protein
MIRFGADHVKINKIIFDTKSRGLLMVEQMISETAQFYFDGRCCVTFLPKDVTTRFMVREDELDGISSFAARIKGVVCGITIKESEENKYRVSVRTVSPYDAAKICMTFGGGGHLNAAGCVMTGTLDDVTGLLLEAAEKELL